ncbi:Crp/Fnr family transcriptional regulator [Leuconostoc lactis]|uniref:Crp/Fnr family transcriptional regulator n=1 Tax=Leuconostoc lactis TaxID=1246 RepID=UPI0024ACF24E|nr:Crp/Fnr family transcriptional regulator [Leuconostoc lactis]MDI6495678.1 Crp/Fnr family transcriptional regulator [Leuconostoc lactis]
MLCVQLVPIFQGLEYNQQLKIEQLVRRTHVQKQETVLMPGDPGQLIILERGQLKAVQYTDDGREKLQFFMNTGDYTGENWLFGEENTHTFLIATEDSLVCHIAADDFNQLLVSLPDLSYQLLKSMVNHNNQLLQQNAYLAIGRIEARLLAYFNDLTIQQQSQTITLPFNLKDLAAYLGTTPETISRKIATLVESHQITKLSNLKYRIH